MHSRQQEPHEAQGGVARRPPNCCDRFFVSRARLLICESDMYAHEAAVRNTVSCRSTSAIVARASFSDVVSRIAFGAGKAVLHPVACDPVPGARGRGSRDRNASGAWRLAALASPVVSQRLDA